MQSDIKSYERTLLRKNQYDKDSKDSVERVKGRIEAICLDNNIYSYEQIEEINDLLDTIEQNKRQYINPTAFIFGRYVIVNKNIDGKKLNDVFNKYSNILQDNSVDKVDVIRYARLWFSILDKDVKKETKKTMVEEPEFAEDVDTDEEYTYEDDE
jgi:hypothetical protein